MKLPLKKYWISLGITYLALILVVGGGYFFVIGPQSRKLSEFQRRRNEVKEHFEAANLSSTQQARDRMLKDLEEKKSILNDLMINSEKTAAITFDIGQTANQLNVKEFSSKRKDSQTQKVLDGCRNLGETWIDISFEGTFLQFARFINLLERNTPVVFIEKFSIKRHLNNEQLPEIDLGVAFFVRQKELAAAQ